MNIQPTTSSTGYGNDMTIPSYLVKCGQLDLQVLHDPTVQLAGLITDPNKTGPAVITWLSGPSVSVQNTSVSLGWVKSYQYEGDLDGKAMTANMVIKLTDAVNNTYGNTGAIQNTTAS